jgi:hypothetical protein
MPSVREVVLFVRALPVAMAAQGVQGEPLPEVVDKVRRLSGRIRVERIEDAVQAAQRACNRWSRWFGGIDTCLTRSLVAGGLLAGEREVVLHVGFRPSGRGIEAVDGHAWLEVDGEIVELTGRDHEHDEPYAKSLELRM